MADKFDARASASTTAGTSGELNRRSILKSAAGAAGLLAAARLALPSGAFAQSAGPEVNIVI